MTRRIAFLGPYGTFTEEAARYFFSEADRYVPYGSIPDVLDAVAQKEVDYAVVPLENSIEGSVNLTIDWLIHEIDLPILAELVLPIAQHLLVARKDQPFSLSHVQKIYSHPQAVAQCRHFLRRHLPEAAIEYTNSTAEAAKIVSQHPEHPWAAIGTHLASQIYSLSLLQENIEDYKNNFTRFILVGEARPELAESDKYRTSILVTLPQDFPGALYQVLAAFAWRKINLSRIESRPTKTGLGNYHFIIDIEQGMDDVLLPGAFAEIEALGCHVRRLGSYPCYVKTLKKKIESY
ncbi:prephenate dehydratase [Bacillaceae bacterium]